MKRVVAVIPARLDSRRFFRKVLYPYRGKPVLYHIWQQVRKAKLIDRTLVATDSVEVAGALEPYGVEVRLTSRRARTGSDRVAEAVTGMPADLVINVQGDTFGLSPAALDRVITAMRGDRSITFATLARSIRDDDELFDPGVVKVVTATDGRPLWFSRFPLPFLQNADSRARSTQFKFLAHIGVYFFRRQALAAFAGWKRTPCEKAESLEQLRILENGGIMRVFRTSARTISIDSPDDLKKIAG